MYKPCYPGGFKDGKDGQTPITSDALNHMESGIKIACALAAFALLFAAALVVERE